MVHRRFQFLGLKKFIDRLRREAQIPPARVEFVRRHLFPLIVFGRDPDGFGFDPEVDVFGDEDDGLALLGQPEGGFEHPVVFAVVFEAMGEGRPRPDFDVSWPPCSRGTPSVSLPCWRSSFR